MKKFVLVLLCCVSSFLFAGPAQLNAMLKNYQNFQANFSETIIDKQGNRSVSTGTVYIQKPNQFRWETKTPNEQLFVSNGKQVWNVEPDLEQVTITPLQQNLSTTPLLLLSGNIKNISTVFQVVQTYATYYRLTPKKRDSMVKTIFIGFNSEGLIRTLQIDNKMGQTSKIDFTDVKANQKLPNSLFTYTPAKNMSVLSQ